MSTSPGHEAAPGPDAPIDLAHLRSQTLGDRQLEAELLDLFAGQAARILADLAASSGGAPGVRRRRADLLHRLCGSARAVGAWHVAAGAESLERQEREGTATPSHGSAGLGRLDSQITSACEAIDDLRRARGHDEDGAP